MFARIFAAAAGLLLLIVLALWNANAAQGRKISSLEAEARAVARSDNAANRGRAVVNAGEPRVETIYRDVIREVASAPISDACRTDPALAVAYAGAERMRDAHEDAIRVAAGRNYGALLSPDADQEPEPGHSGARAADH